MAIAFNLPSEREAAEENFSRLNRLLAELYEVLCHILVSRQPGQEVQENRRDRPFSESDLPRPPPPPQPCRRSASSPPLTLNFDGELEDDVFGPRVDTLDIYARNRSGVLLSPRRERSFTFSVTNEKHWRDKGGTDVADGVGTDETDAAPPERYDEKTESSLLSSIIPDKLSGSICTAVLFMVGWKLFCNKR
ncbi:uncharacterized protein LOC121736000 [Aricia agestis]|uniref:uncharacterized protein LOC121736000 n=1 Tax=Aricia agestis TaxID=91739 RepID=UPI001C20BA88|nr:uncharacterized protein LOC121736000 [Aricia agestis]